ncbi:MAG: glycosyltransferase, partial [Actinobacteria bacterium]|nr:glycosyltransferase [Actinomycetota bacterium]
MERRLKILLWHGYLLGGTGSNVYTRALARVWSRLGHEVVVFAQEPHPERFDVGHATVVRPDLAGGPLPVFVLDRYEDLEARYLQDLTREERQAFAERNAAAVREHLPADFLLVNHVLLGAPVGAAVGMPFSVKAHGSELEFSMRGND